MAERCNSSQSSCPAQPARREALFLLIFTWVVVIGAGQAAILQHSFFAEAAVPAVREWPTAFPWQRSQTHATLVVFLHPRCPCSTATLTELGNILAAAPNAADVRLVFFAPEQTTPEWTDSSLVRLARSLPDVTIEWDTNGELARKIACRTSGQVLLFDRAGALQFNGGITISRGHIGNNPGRTAVQQVLQGKPADCHETPVFGCSLATPAITLPCEGTVCHRPS